MLTLLAACLPGMEEKTTDKGASTGSAMRPPWQHHGIRLQRKTPSHKRWLRHAAPSGLLPCAALACFSRASAVDLENRGSATCSLQLWKHPPLSTLLSWRSCHFEVLASSSSMSMILPKSCKR